jgi:hypothetical protein
VNLTSLLADAAPGPSLGTLVGAISVGVFATAAVVATGLWVVNGPDPPRPGRWVLLEIAGFEGAMLLALAVFGLLGQLDLRVGAA